MDYIGGLLALMLGFLLIAFWVRMLLDALSRLPPNADKVCWVLVLLFLNLFGAFLYYWVIFWPCRTRGKRLSA